MHPDRPSAAKRGYGSKWQRLSKAYLRRHPGTYFVLADIAPYMKKGQSDVEFCVEMAQKVGVACVPGSSFFDEDVNHIVRLHFAKKDETLLAALDRLSNLRRIMCG